MKQRLLHILLLLTLSICAGNYAWGQYYVLNELSDSYYELNTIETGPEYALSGPGETLTFEAWKSTWAAEYFYVQAYVNGSWTNIMNPDLEDKTWVAYSCSVPTAATKIRFLTTTGATLKKRYRKVKVTRATTFSASPTSISWGQILLGETKSQDITIQYSNTYDQTLTATCDNSVFVLNGNSWSIGASGTINLNVSFTANILGYHSGNIILQRSGTTVATIPIDVTVTQVASLAASPASISWGEVLLGDSKSQHIEITYTNEYNQPLTASCDNSAFVLDGNSWSLESSGTIGLNVSFLANTLGSYSGNITLQQGGVTLAVIPIDATVIGKYSTIFDFSLDAISQNHIYYLSDYFSSNNPNAYNIVSNDESKAKIIDGKLYVFAESGDISLTISQEGSDTWQSHSETYTLNVTNAQTETYTSVVGDFDIFDGVVWDEYNKQLAFPFPCDKVTYDVELQLAAANFFTVKVSKDHGTNWETLENANRNITEDRQSITEIVETTTTHIDLIRESGSSLALHFYDFTFHMADYMTPDLASVDLGRVMIGNSSEQKTVVVDWSNVENYNTLNVVCDNPNFTVSVENNPCTPYNQTWGTSCERWGQSTISVSYTPTAEGSHTGNIYFNDNKRFVTIPVNGEGYQALTLNPLLNASSQVPEGETFYSVVSILRTLPSGHSTITFPFDYNISAIEGGYAAQLALVTYNAQDGYTLFFEKVADGLMKANQPYLLSLPYEIANPIWTDITVFTPNAGCIEVDGWTMQANYTPGLSMEGKYGIAGGKFCKGTATATINAYAVYFTPPSTANTRVKAAVLDDNGEITYIGQLETDGQEHIPTIYRIDGSRLQRMQKGINIVRMQDGTVRKVIQ